MEKTPVNLPQKVVIFGGSAGSLEVLLQVLPALTSVDGIAVVVVLHRKSADDNRLEELFRMKSNLSIKEIEDKTFIKAGRVHVAPADYHLLLDKNGTFALDISEKVNFSRPSIDIAFETAARVFKDKLTAVLLSGANADGTVGLLHVRENLGTIIIQDPKTAEIPYMPSVALEKLTPDHVMTPIQITEFIESLVTKG